MNGCSGCIDGTACSLQNSCAKYAGNKMQRQFQNFSFCLSYMCGNTSVETFVYYVSNGFGIPWHFVKGYDLVF